MYLAAAVAGNVASFYGSTAPSLGASGAIFGVGGALAMYFYRNRWGGAGGRYWWQYITCTAGCAGWSSGCIQGAHMYAPAVPQPTQHRLLTIATPPQAHPTPHSFI